MRTLGVVLVAFLLSGDVYAQQADPVAAFRARVEAAVQLMEADPQGAAEALDHLAVDSIELRRARTLTPDERAVHTKLFLLRGRAHLQLLANDKAQESFRELLRLAPTFAGELSPLEQQLVDSLRQKESGVLEVTSVVPGAHVLVDGLDVGVTGETAVRASLIAGTYEVRIEKARFKTAIGRATVTTGQTLTLSDLVPVQNIPPVALLSDRDGVDVVADNVSAGRMMKLATLRTQISAEESAAIDRFVVLAKLDPQTAAGLLLRQPALDRPMTIRFHRECFVDETRPIALTSAVLDTLDPLEPVAWLGNSAVLRMVPDVGTVRIASTPSDADVFLDGQLVGRTPFERDVCAGPHRIRIRHRIGSYNIAATITRGRTEAIDVPLKPDVAFLGAVDPSGAAVPDLTALVDRALATGLTSYHLASRQDLPPEVKPWTDALTAALAAAADKGDRDAVTRLQKQAGANFDAPLLLCAVRRAGAAQFDVLLFWNEHPDVDRVTVAGTTDKQLASAVEQINAPLDVGELIARNDIGVRVAETGLPSSALLIVAVRPGSAAAVAGLKVGESIAAVDRTPATAAQMADKIAARKPGDLIVLQVVGANAAARDVSMALQRVVRRAPVFDTTWPGNSLIAKLTARSLGTTTPAERDLIAFNLAATYMRFGEWRQALALLTSLPNIPRGEGVGPGMAKYLAARCREELGERDQAIALYKEAAGIEDEVATDDGATVGALARYRLAAMAIR